MRVLESLNAGLRGALADCQQAWLIGEDLLDPYGGAFKVAQGLSTEFPERVITTPVSEAGIVGLGVGMALRGMRPVIEIMFGDFLTLAADQLVNHAAKLHWMSGGKVKVPLVVRTPMGGRRGYGPTHSQTLEKHFLGVPGLRVVAACEFDEPGAMLRSALLDDDDPVLFVEHKLLYALLVQDLDSTPGVEMERIGSVYPTYRRRIAGAPAPILTLAAYGYMAHLALEAQDRLAYEHEIFSDLLVFTQLSPLPQAPLLESLAQTGALLTVEEGSRTAGWGAEVLAQALESRIPLKRARRIAARNLPVPAAQSLEAVVLPQVDDILAAVLEMRRLL